MKKPDALDELIFNYRFKQTLRKQRTLSARKAYRKFIAKRTETYQKLNNWFN